MATLSITREFEVKTVEAYQKLQELIESDTTETEKLENVPTLAEGEELLKSFSFR